MMDYFPYEDRKEYFTALSRKKGSGIFFVCPIRFITFYLDYSESTKQIVDNNFFIGFQLKNELLKKLFFIFKHFLYT
jgi:hypothetical protein